MTAQSFRRGAGRMSGSGLEKGLAVLLIVTFVTGGGSQDHGPEDALAQLLALPVLFMAVMALARQPMHGLRRASIVVAMLIVAIPSLQLLPIPPELWGWAPARTTLMHDLHVAGAGQPVLWTLTPTATERALWSLLPALAIFLGALSLDNQGQGHRRLLYLIVALVLVSAILGLVQRGVAQDSLLNPFPQWMPASGGLFANPNHQASALTVGAVLAAGLWLDARHTQQRMPSPHWHRWALAGCGVVFLGVLPLTDSRAGLLIAAPALMGLLLMAGAFNWRNADAAGLSRGWMAVAIGVIAASGYLGLRWFQLSMTDEARWPMAVATSDLAIELWPLGAGVGSFVPWFEQAGPNAMLFGEYINHAHNEYVQWWLEGGVIALLVLAASLALLMLVLRALLQKRAGHPGLAAWVGVSTLLASSLVDYPLRTAALMTVGACLAGIAVAQSSRIRVN